MLVLFMKIKGNITFILPKRKKEKNIKKPLIVINVDFVTNSFENHKNKRLSLKTKREKNNFSF